MSDKVLLYSYFRSSASWRVRIALAFKGIDYEYKAIHLVKAEQKGDEYKDVNPMCQVPTLHIDGQQLTQSLPIIEYLDETRQGHKLLPTDPVKRFQARRLAEMINSGIQPVQNLSVLQRLAEITGSPDSKADWGKEWITRGFDALESELVKTAGTYSVGDEVTVADLALVPQVYNANRFKVDMSSYPTISRVNDSCIKLPQFQAADPTAQPDCPEELK